MLEDLIADVAEILKVTKIKPKRIILMAAPRWKQEMVTEALAHPQEKPEVSSLIKSGIAKVRTPDARKEVPQFAKELVADVARASSEDRGLMSVAFDELSVLRRAKSFLETEFGCRVEIFSADDPARTDPKGKAKHAKPRRPAVYLE